MWVLTRSSRWNHLFPPFFSAAVPCNSELPPSVEHASVMAVWDRGVQSNLPLHLCPEELLHRWVIQHTVASKDVGVCRCPRYRAATFVTNQARFVIKITCSLFSPCVASDLIQDWASDSAPDIYSFVPYSWKFKMLFHQFEMIWAANQHNWIDCSTKQQENGMKETLQP